MSFLKDFNSPAKSTDSLETIDLSEDQQYPNSPDTIDLSSGISDSSSPPLKRLRQLSCSIISSNSLPTISSGDIGDTSQEDANYNEENLGCTPFTEDSEGDENSTQEQPEIDTALADDSSLCLTSINDQINEQNFSQHGPELSTNTMDKPVIFIYLPNADQYEVSSVEKRLLRLYTGASICNFFHIDVTHIVTDLNTYKLKSDLQSNDNCKLVNTKSSRASSLLAMAVKTKGSSNPIERAEMYGIKVVLVENIFQRDSTSVNCESLNQLKMRQDHTHDRGQNYVRKLRDPFIKVEDKSRLYRPLVLEMKSWPCHIDTLLQETTSDECRSWNYQKKKKMTKNLINYCALCKSHFAPVALDYHLKTNEHIANANNDDNWIGVDTLIDNLPSVDDYVKKITQKLA